MQYKAGQIWKKLEGRPGNQKAFTVQILTMFYDLHGRPKLVIQRHPKNRGYVRGSRHPAKLVTPCYMCSFVKVLKPILEDQS